MKTRFHIFLQKLNSLLVQKKNTKTSEELKLQVLQSVDPSLVVISPLTVSSFIATIREA